MRKKIWIIVPIIAWLLIFVIPHHGIPDESQKVVLMLPRIWFQEVESEEIRKRKEALDFIQSRLSGNNMAQELYQIKNEGNDDDWTIGLVPKKDTVFSLPFFERILFLDFSVEPIPFWTIDHLQDTYTIHNQSEVSTPFARPSLTP